ncbi:MAG: FAD-binding protein [Candidatus Lokiarchaeota archaeon]|nr:FAD-binding protein [Candidatus Lokiarchaeota archaeon]
MKGIYKELKTIFGSDKVFKDLEILNEYQSDRNLGMVESIVPKYLVYPTNIKQIQQLVRVSKENGYVLVPTSSKPPRSHCTSVPRKENSIIVNFTRMKKVLNLDLKNRGVMLEPGVNFQEFIKTSKEKGFRPHLPLYPYAKKSVVGAALDREPILIPKYHWDISDPLLCLETVFGTGSIFRTGAAAGPGNLTEQIEAGGAQKNPMGPTQFSPFRLIQGSQGSIGLISWATLKIERPINSRKILYATSDDLNDNFDFIYEILKYRLGDEIFIVNDLNLAILIGENKKEIEKLRQILPNWICIISIAGSGAFAQDKIDWQISDIRDYAKKFGVEIESTLPEINEEKVRMILEEASPDPWRLKYLGGCNDIFFISTLDKTPQFDKIIHNIAKNEKLNPLNIGVYIQPLVQGCNVHCEFDLYYEPDNDDEFEKVKKTSIAATKALIKKGAFFNRPYGILTDIVFDNIDQEIITSMNKVKNIFDPNNILNPGVLCFKEG